MAPLTVSTLIVVTETASLLATFSALSAVLFSVLLSAGSESLDSGALQPVTVMVATSAVMSTVSRGRLKVGAAMWLENRIVDIDNSVYDGFWQFLYNLRDKKLHLTLG
jgi:hypothetical protein